MSGMYLALSFLLLAIVATATEDFPHCPQVECPEGNNKVACFIDDRACICTCTRDQDPCASLRTRTCPEGHTLSCCSREDTCKCKCVLK
ncbi:uncharacterized protein LOC144132697 isoform X2 [Amblyomma americanum]